MSTIDQAARILKKSGGNELVLVSGRPARILQDDEQIGQTQTFDQWEINALVEETAPSDLLPDILLGEPVEYDHRHEVGTLHIRVVPGPSVWRVALVATDDFVASTPDASWLDQEPVSISPVGEGEGQTERPEPAPSESGNEPASPEEHPLPAPGEDSVESLDLSPPSPDSQPVIHWLEDDSQAEPLHSGDPAATSPSSNQEEQEKHLDRNAESDHDENSADMPPGKQQSRPAANIPTDPNRRPRRGSGTFLGMPDPTQATSEDANSADDFDWDDDFDDPDDADSIYPTEVRVDAGGNDDPVPVPEDKIRLAREQSRTPTADLTQESSRRRRGSDSSRTKRAIPRPGDHSTKLTPRHREMVQSDPSRPALPGLTSMLEGAMETGAFELHVIEGQRPWVCTARGFGPLPQAQAPVRSVAFDELERNISDPQRNSLHDRGWLRFMWDGGLRIGTVRCTLAASSPRSLVAHVHLLERRSAEAIGLTNDMIQAVQGGLTIVAGPGQCGRTTLATALVESALSSGLRSALVAGWPPELVPHVTAPITLLDRTDTADSGDKVVETALALGTGLLLTDDCSSQDLAACLRGANEGLTVVVVRRSQSLQAVTRELAEAAASITVSAAALLSDTVHQVLFLRPPKNLRRRRPDLFHIVPPADLWAAHLEGMADLASRVLEQHAKAVAMHTNPT